MDEAERERQARVEDRVAWVRLAVVAFLVAVYVGPMGRTVENTALADAVLAVASAYSLAVIVGAPHRRYPGLAAGGVVSLTDAVLITLVLHATGGVASPFHVLWYISLVALAFRTDLRGTLAGAGFYLTLYGGLLAYRGQLLPPTTPVVVRLGFIGLVGLLAGSLSDLGLEDNRQLRQVQDERDKIDTEHQRVQRRVEKVHKEKSARERRIRRLESENEALRDHAAALSRRLRDPLDEAATRLRSAAGRDGLPNPAARQVRGARSALDRARRLTRDVLVYREVGSKPKDVRTVDLGEALEAALDDLEPDLPRDRVSVDPEGLPEAPADPALLRRLLRRVLENAARFGDDETRIRVRGEARNGDVHLAVVDDGPGPPDDLESPTEPFVAGGRPAAGNGLGLAIAGRVADRHGGDLTLEEAPEGGARVEVVLPRVGRIV